MTNLDRRIAPVEERFHLLDTLRAIALYGVITFNVAGMSAAFVAGEIFPKAGALDKAFMLFDLILVQGKARAAFALLFGIGFGLMMERMTMRGHRFTSFYLRRMTVLLAFGLFNLTFLYFGDILILYALMGMILLLFQRVSDRALLGLGLALIVVPSLGVGVVELATGAPMPSLGGGDPDTLFRALRPAYEGHSFAAYVVANLRYYVEHYRFETSYAIVYDLGVLGLFLTGLWVARRRVLIDTKQWAPTLRWVAWICLPLGLVFSIVHGSRRLGIPAHGAAYAAVTTAYAGLAIMAFGYVALFALLLSGKGQRVHRALSPAGRMALTCYLASNAIGSFVTYGWGLGMLGRMNGFALNMLSITIYAALCVLSAIWLSRFRFGPAEWIWRSLTYGQAQPMHRQRWVPSAR
ncbi:MAG: DUF418 domain-containing protein [Sphingomonas phyllosphaerae]